MRNKDTSDQLKALMAEIKSCTVTKNMIVDSILTKLDGIEKVAQELYEEEEKGE